LRYTEEDEVKYRGVGATLGQALVEGPEVKYNCIEGLVKL
jgi:hypothetical protein